MSLPHTKIIQQKMHGVSAVRALYATPQHTALVGQEREDPGYEFTRATGAFLHPPLPGVPEPRFRPIGRPQVGVVLSGPA
jgi:hypothetical protein